MGYHITLDNSTVLLPTQNLPQILQRWKDLNDPKNDHLKEGGGSYSNGQKNAKWFSWMSEHYDQECSTCEEILEMLGFETDTTFDGICLNYYYSKTGQEELFFKTIADLIPNGEMEWSGEDGEFWKWIFDGKTMKIKQGKKTYID